MFWLMPIIGLALASIEALAARHNRATRASGETTPSWVTVHRWRWVVGIPFAVLSAFVIYPMSGATESYRVMGFPFMVAVFDQAGRDYVGPFTPFAFAANTAVWYFLPHLFLWAWALLIRHTSRGAGS